MQLRVESRSSFPATLHSVRRQRCVLRVQTATHAAQTLQKRCDVSARAAARAKRFTAARSSALIAGAERAVACTAALLHTFSRSAPLKPLVATAAADIQSGPTLASLICARRADRMLHRAASGGGGTRTQRSRRPCLRCAALLTET
jgi:hypothetical protein